MASKPSQLPGAPDSQVVGTPQKPSLWTLRRQLAAVALLLVVPYALAVLSLTRENPTVDEVIHLPAGISYWETGQFRLYRHNPPLVKLVAALPVILSNPRPVTAPLYQSSYWKSEPPNKAGFAHDFARLNAPDYFELFTRARLLMPAFAALGGLFVFLWSRALFGPAGGLFSLALWSFCPNVLAHSRLVTTDVPAAAIMTAAMFTYWRYLKRPSWKRAAVAGLLLGLAQATKFSALILGPVWLLLAVVTLLVQKRDQFDLKAIGRLLGHAALILVLATLVINACYGFDQVGLRLGQPSFLCRTLTVDREPPPPPPAPGQPFDLLREVQRLRVNRFRGTLLENLPVPLPRDYVMGFDDQKFEAEGAPLRVMDRSAPADAVTGYPVYLDGVLRDQSWWDYYLRALSYKIPEGTLILVGGSLLLLILARTARAGWTDELAVLIVPGVVLLVMSVFTNINLGLRYVMPALPLLFIAAGRWVPWSSTLHGAKRKAAATLMAASLAATVASALWIHPHYLAYFNVVSGGPGRGLAHLIDSNLDWGQDLVNLRKWLETHAPGERVGIAYFGQIPPEIFAARGEPLDWYLPPIWPPSWDGRKPLPPRIMMEGLDKPPGPGLYAISASLLRGLPWRVYDSNLPGFPEWRAWAPFEAGEHAFSYFEGFKPIHSIGHSILIYRLSPDEANDLASRWRLRP